MAGTIVHRGPDDGDVWVDAGAGIALAHRRLAIVDLSESGRQPMHSISGRYVIVFNGEIYNHGEIRSELDRMHRHQIWRGTSDTETLLAAVDAWGLEAAVCRCVGMFAFALWDRAERQLALVRDRIGEKPLYYSTLGGAITFASELKALRQVPDLKLEVDRNALALFFRHNYIPSPRSIYKGVHKLPPGTMAIFSGPGREPSLHAYWSAADAAQRGLEDPYCGSDVEAADELERLLKQSIRGQMLADVPLGAFLSGGIDSSAIVAMMQELSSDAVSTFTIGFQQSAFNEAPFAKSVAEHLGTKHTEVYLTERDMLDVVPRLSALYDEPFADSSQIATFLVSRVARQHVTVSLSGDAGDELFGGYSRYFLSRRIWSVLGRIPVSLRTLCANAIKGVSPRSWNRLLNPMMKLLPSDLRYPNPGDKLHKISEILDIRARSDLYLRLTSHWRNPEQLVLGSTEPPTDVSRWDVDRRASFEQQMMELDIRSYLPDDILVKVDRAAMGVSLETRVPMLDHRLVEFALSLPLHMKIRGGVGKWLLRQSVYRRVPRQLLERPKTGFGVPIDDWLRGPLRDWASSLLADGRIRAEGFLESTLIQRAWKAHLTGSVNLGYPLWDVLMFQAWLSDQETVVRGGQASDRRDASLPLSSSWRS